MYKQPRTCIVCTYQHCSRYSVLLGTRKTGQMCHSVVKISKPYLSYCYVINYAPETGQPCYRLQIRNVQGYNEQVVASTRFTMRTTRNAD
jgi:hypothetical protein